MLSSLKTTTGLDIGNKSILGEGEREKGRDGTEREREMEGEEAKREGREGREGENKDE